MNRRMPMWLAVVIHLSGAAMGFLASVMYFVAGLEYQGNIYAMITCLWVFTLGMRIIERRRKP